LALELGWALPPIMLQLGFGVDILWRQRRVVLGTIVPMTLYLSAADALAIGWGTWTIDPEQSLHFLLGGVLPIEEFVFFLLTNVLPTFGVTLLMSVESHERIGALRQKWLSARGQMRLGA
jgi:lycopene cyclase domain-containing protein